MSLASAESVGLAPSFVARLERLSFRSRRSVMGVGAGQRNSPRPGTSAEFADYRTYVAGDDFRRVDWNAFARLDRLMLRLYLGEEDLSVHLFVDVSTSMRWGRPPKDAAARTLAAALAYVGLAGFDRVGVSGFAEKLAGTQRPLRGRQSCTRLWGALAALPAGTASDFSALAGAARTLRPGITVVLSDFLTDSDIARGVGALRAARQQVVMLQILAPQEVDPEVSGDVALTDVESGASLDVTVTPALIGAYKENLAAHEATLRAIARRNGALFHRVLSDEPVETLVIDSLRRAGILS